jgi:hypothetical protein
MIRRILNESDETIRSRIETGKIRKAGPEEPEGQRI